MPNGALEITYGCATKVAGAMSIVYWCAPLVEGSLGLVYGNASLVAGQLELVYGATTPVAGVLEIAYMVSAGTVDGSLEIVYHAPESVPVEGCVEIIYSHGALAGWHEDHSATGSITVDGVAVGASEIRLENHLAWMTCTITLQTEADYLRCIPGATVTVAAAGELFVFLVEEGTRSPSHGNVDYQFTALSPVAWLDAPYAATVADELTGMAATLAAGLMAPVSVAWQTVDWYIPPATWYGGDQTPLELVRQLAAAAGAELQSLPDGTLLVAPLYPVSLPQWPTATVAATLVDRLSFFAIDEVFDFRPGYNRYLVTDQLTDQDTLRLVEEQVDTATRMVYGYQTPWSGLFSLSHTGGPWVTVEPLGFQERQETETVEIVSGSGQAAYPVYSLDAVQWLQDDLGSVTFNEDGLLETTTVAESLANITYTTRCRRWLVRDPRAEQLQLVLETD